ncbi:MAG: polysaccharide deacetylase family protein [Chloroflexi bacterium]|nr:polysaccharide deacetylase family protein [Chloroflexota bacterium]
MAPNERANKVHEVVDTLGVSLPTDLMMTHALVKDLTEQTMAIGAHTVNHPILKQIDADSARHELADSRDMLQSLTGEPVKLFAYPNGKPGQDYTAVHVKLLEELGFKAAVSTAWGVATVQSDIYQLPRFTPWDKSPKRFVMRLIQNCLRVNSERVVC